MGNMSLNSFWIIFFLCYACSSILVGVYGNAQNVSNKTLASGSNKRRVVKTSGDLPKNESQDFDKLEKNKSHESKIKISPMENHTKLAKANKTDNPDTVDKVSKYKSNISSANQRLEMKDHKLLRAKGHGSAVINNQYVKEVGGKLLNQSKNGEITAKTTKGSRKTKNLTRNRDSGDPMAVKRAKKLLVSFFDGESNETIIPKLQHGETKDNNSKRIDSKSKYINQTNHTTSQQLYKRTRLLYTDAGNAAETRQLRVENPKQNDQVIETSLPSGPSAEGPQHVRVSNQPTHVMFKPVHKYYPAIHRYMTRPIHRFLNKPVDLGSLGPKIAAPPFVVQHHPVQGTQVGAVQDVRPGPILQDSIPGGLARVTNPVQGSAGQLSPVRIYAPLAPRIQPVLIHPHKMSPTGYGPCTTTPCKNGAVCSSVNDQPLCICRPGFRGQFCELINKCHPNPCHNSGSCTETERDFECTCSKAYRGKRCEVENKCEPNPCVNGGTCSETEDDYVCTCREGFLGHSCEVESKCGPINPCKNGATCQEARETYKCFCRDGFTGYNCEARIKYSHCIPNPCAHGGFCTVTGTSTANYTCSCLDGWKGATCTEKVDNWGNTVGPSICDSMNPCTFGGTCVPGRYYDYTCSCPPGRGGTNCEHNMVGNTPVDSCRHCHAFARCLSHRCTCNEGYEGDGRNCVPVHQYCHPNPCYNGGTCRERPKREQPSSIAQRQWWCECAKGYSGTNCQEMDLCHLHLCQNGGHCLSSQGQAKCLCQTPYRGKYCEEKDVCHENPCRNGGTCRDVEGVPTCTCTPEFDGASCDHWKCSQCDRNARCNKGTCVCNNNYIGDGKTCRKKVPSKSNVPAVTVPPTHAPVQLAVPIRRRFCDSNPCASGATCLEALQTYFCQCPEDKYGKQCDQTPEVIGDLCSKCDVDATCRDGRCVCNEGYTGSGFNCRKSQVVPQESITHNLHKTDSSCDYCPENGQCLDNVCVCPPGFESRKRSCVAIDVPRMRNTIALKAMPPGIEYVGQTRNRLPVGQWKEDSVVSEYQSLGCWADTTDWKNPLMRAIEPLEGLHPLLNDDYKKRGNPITKCARAAKAYGYKIFAVQNGGQCFSGAHADQSYTTYGPSTLCRFGVGGTLSNDVYKLK